MVDSVVPGTSGASSSAGPFALPKQDKLWAALRQRFNNPFTLIPFYIFGHLFFVQVPRFSAAPDEGEEDMTTLSAIVTGPNMKIYVTGAGRYSLYHSRPQAAFAKVVGYVYLAGSNFFR